MAWPSASNAGMPIFLASVVNPLVPSSGSLYRYRETSGSSYMATIPLRSAGSNGRKSKRGVSMGKGGMLTGGTLTAVSKPVRPPLTVRYTKYVTNERGGGEGEREEPL